MQEFRDGSFGETEPADTMLERLLHEGIPENLARLHFGSVKELERLRRRAVREGVRPGKRAQAERRIERLAEQVARLEARLNEVTVRSHTDGVRVYPATALASAASLAAGTAKGG
jgi:hypothetical protein